MAPFVLGGNTPGSSPRVTPLAAILTSSSPSAFSGKVRDASPALADSEHSVNVFASASPGEGGGGLITQGERGSWQQQPCRAAPQLPHQTSHLLIFEVGRHLRSVDAVGLDAWAVTAPSARGISVRFR